MSSILSKEQSIYVHRLLKYTKQSWILAWPILLTNLATPILAMTDASILGHLPNVAFLAALSIGASLFSYILWGFNCISLSCSTYTASANATANNQLVLNRLLQFLWIAFLTSFFIFILMQFSLSWLIDQLSISDQLKKHCIEYLSIMSFSVFPLLLIQSSVAWFTGLKKTKIALYVLLISSFINIILDLIFVFGLKMDIDGVALASVCAQYVTLFAVLIFIKIHLSKQQIQFKIDLSSWIEKSYIFNFGGALLVRSGILLSVLFIFNLKSAQISDNIAGANALIMTLLILLSSVMDSTASSAQVQILNHKDQQPWILRSTFFLLMIFVGLFILLITLFGNAYLYWISNQPQTVDIAKDFLFWMSCLCITSALSYWLDGVFLGWQKSNWMRNAVIFSACLYFPLIWLIDSSNHGLWFSLNVFMLLRSLWMLFYFTKELNYAQPNQQQL